MDGSRTSKWRVLVAVGCPATRSWVRAALSSLDAECEEADSGWQALARILDRGPYDLVVASQRLRGVNGAQVLGIMRGEGVGSPFLLLAPFCKESVRALAQRAGRAIVIEDVLDATVLRAAGQALLTRPDERPEPLVDEAWRTASGL